MITLTKVGNNVKYVGVDNLDNTSVSLNQANEITIDGSNVAIHHGSVRINTTLSNLSIGGTTPTDEATFWTALATVFPSAAPATALPTEYPATYAAMQASITADPTTKRDFFVTADETNGGEFTRYYYNGTDIFWIPMQTI